MAPSRRKPTGTTTAVAATASEATVRKIMTRSIYKKQKKMLSKESSPTSPAAAPEPSSSSSSLSSSASATTTNHHEDSCNKKLNSLVAAGAINDACCLTPKGEKYMIPKITTCPPAPKKKRLVLDFSPLKRGSAPSSPSSATFFAHSELEFFFLYPPSRNIQV